LPLPYIPRRTAVCKIKQRCDKAEKKISRTDGRVCSLDVNNSVISESGLRAFISAIFPEIMRRIGPAKQKSKKEIIRSISK
jgi:hypothetical protein